MKKMIHALLVLVTLAVSASAMASPAHPYPPYPYPYPAPYPYPYPQPYPYPYPAPYPPQPNYVRDRVVCQSLAKLYTECETNLNQIYGIQIINQISNHECRQGYDFGINGRRVWVNRGCRAEFIVYGY